eukprot:TRINITY_DN53793_c0_g1_i1.p1 TRINITY_DN53793_c0_g1~~TRINITY_DN53793_c0_g1_i1.p1  ORF type:complete len:227 (+),score=41.69 TRINITY_DN53793_c0_g1_i1:33-683(+)
MGVEQSCSRACDENSVEAHGKPTRLKARTEIHVNGDGSSRQPVSKQPDPATADSDQLDSVKLSPIEALNFVSSATQMGEEALVSNVGRQEHRNGNDASILWKQQSETDSTKESPGSLRLSGSDALEKECSTLRNQLAEALFMREEQERQLSQLQSELLKEQDRAKRFEDRWSTVCRQLAAIASGLESDIASAQCDTTDEQHSCDGETCSESVEAKG